MFKLISTLGLSHSAFEVNNSLVLPFKWSRFEHTLCRERLCQAFQRAVCIFLCQEIFIVLQTKGTFQKDEALSLRNLGPPGQVDVRRWSVFVFEVHSRSQMGGPS